MFNSWLVVPTFLVILVSLPLQATAISGKDPASSKNFATPDEAADKGIALVREITDDARAKELGFESAAEAHEAQRGEPFHVYRIRLNELNNFNPGDDPKTLFFETHSLLYPLRVRCSTGPLPCKDGVVRSSLTVHEFQKSPGGWRATMRGAKNLIVKLEQFRTSASNSLCMVPALNIYILCDLTGEQLTMIPIESRYGLNAGQRVSALEGIARFVRLAGDLNDDEFDQDFDGGAS